MSIYERPCSRKACQGKKCKHKHYHYRFGMGGRKYRGSLPESQTKWEAEQAEVKIKRDLFEGKFSNPASGKDNFGEFVTVEYLPWARVNKKSFKNDESRSKVILQRLGKKSFRDITPEMIEKFKCDLAHSITRRRTIRSQADVNRHLEFLAGVFELAIKYGRTDSNPSRRVKHFKEDNERFRYLHQDEEERLLNSMRGRLAHLRPLTIVALGTDILNRRAIVNR